MIRKDLKYVLHKKTCLLLLKATRKEEREQIRQQMTSCHTNHLQWMDKADLSTKNHSTRKCSLLSSERQHQLKVVTFLYSPPSQGTPIENIAFKSLQFSGEPSVRETSSSSSDKVPPSPEVYNSIPALDPSSPTASEEEQAEEKTSR